MPVSIYVRALVDENEPSSNDARIEVNFGHKALKKDIVGAKNM